ncbi:bifunctional DNA primase/polymerase [Leuconostoc mesenteroides]|uniref:bifunctional DNA primase/polymerase n=1 Tax=Leuconostoc mesenteroides TaxID=1245 RepID=UPI0020745D2C|nr:bifunctional DNA primase/polymerase [Leuconostoc mesenteroides]MCM6834250.1 bifunctional DNA primase/polymerase [Leuconostoc mesenteroides]
MNKWEHIKQYQQAGAYVFMALPNQKYNAVEGGFNNSFDDYNDLRQWLQQYPAYHFGNVGIDLSKSNLVVVDIDKHEQNGTASILSWFKTHHIAPDTIQDTYVEQTPTGGLHAFYLIPSGQDKPKHIINAIKGVDVLSNTAVMTAPSIMTSGQYRQITPFDKIKPAPTWVYDLSNGLGTDRPSHTYNARYSLADRWKMTINGFDTGERNNQAMSLAGYLFAIDVTPQDIYDIMQEINARSNEPLPDHELNTVYMSARRREEKKRARMNEYGRD